MAPAGTFWQVLAHAGKFWHMLAGVSTYWQMLAHAGTYWQVSAHAGRCQHMLAHDGRCQHLLARVIICWDLLSSIHTALHLNYKIIDWLFLSSATWSALFCLKTLFTINSLSYLLPGNLLGSSFIWELNIFLYWYFTPTCSLECNIAVII